MRRKVLVVGFGGLLLLVAAAVGYRIASTGKRAMGEYPKTACLDTDMATMTRLVHRVLPGDWWPELKDFRCNRSDFGPLTSAWARIPPGEIAPAAVALQETGSDMSWLLADLPRIYPGLLDGLDPNKQRYARFRVEQTMYVISLVALESGDILFFMFDQGA
ncbi:hypothetical protein [Rhodovulum sulfidophilum]|uniref:hypothetical protein n=2 Tax=Rhodovulum sulfidophilum TaxID=35806 RepID=UPI001922796E|nr:hypothetical protein [Rhodovulum sulfidophilum]MBL3576442.1 hypothetical protein [Rhodovulum sulfidophilum]